MKRRKNSQNQQLKKCLSANEYAKIAAKWITQKRFKEDLKVKLGAIKSAKNKLKEVILICNCSGDYHRNNKKAVTY